jgi:hypothetical protein
VVFEAAPDVAAEVGTGMEQTDPTLVRRFE